MTTIKAILLALAIAGWTFAACDRHADAAESVHCDRAALARAEANAVTAQRIAFESFDPATERMADQMVEAAVAEVRAAQALCYARDTVVDPFETEPAATIEPVELDADEAAWLAVCGTQTAEECGGIETEGR